MNCLTSWVHFLSSVQATTFISSLNEQARCFQVSVLPWISISLLVSLSLLIFTLVKTMSSLKKQASLILFPHIFPSKNYLVSLKLKNNNKSVCLWLSRNLECVLTCVWIFPRVCVCVGFYLSTEKRKSCLRSPPKVTPHFLPFKIPLNWRC